MQEQQAKAVAQALNGEAWQSGGDIWLVVIKRVDGRVIVISDEMVCEYESEDALDEQRQPENSIHLLGPASFVDDHGHMFILGLPVEPGMLTLADLLDDEEPS